VDYALEGIIVTCGATIAWLRDQLGLFAHSAEMQEMALAVEDNGGVYVVPAFSGLGAPHWRMDLRAAILGLTFGSDKRHVARAALESTPYQIKDVMTVMEQDSGVPLRQLKVDGGITANSFVMQFLTDLLGRGRCQYRNPGRLRPRGGVPRRPSRRRLPGCRGTRTTQHRSAEVLSEARTGECPRVVPWMERRRPATAVVAHDTPSQAKGSTDGAEPVKTGHTEMQMFPAESPDPFGVSLRQYRKRSLG
jgi:hypothetical protein